MVMRVHIPTELATDRLSLRPWREDDADFAFDLYSRWEVARFLGRAPAVLTERVEAVRRIADAYNVKTYGDLQVGFKWIGGLIDELGPEKFVLGTDESHGYLVGTYARDKDAVGGAMLLAGLAAEGKAGGFHAGRRARAWRRVTGSRAGGRRGRPAPWTRAPAAP